MKNLILITVLFVGSFAHAFETYLCNENKYLGGKLVAVVWLGQNGGAMIKYDINDVQPGQYNIAYGQYTKNESECPSRLCGNFRINFHAEDLSSRSMAVEKIQGFISQQNYFSRYAEISFYHNGVKGPSTYECTYIGENK